MLTAQALAEEEALKQAQIEDRLLDLDGMNRHIALKLAEKCRNYDPRRAC